MPDAAQPLSRQGLRPILEITSASSTIRLDVAKVAQQRSMSCWYATVCMVGYYFEIGPRQGLPNVWQANSGITPERFVDLARNEGLANATNYRGAGNTYGQAELFRALYYRGPIWCAGYWFGPGHIICLTGVKGGKVIFNDPDGGVEKTNTVAWFNRKVAHGVARHLMSRAPS